MRIISENGGSMKLSSLPEKLYRISVLVLFTAGLFLLSFYSLISTAYITNDAKEKTFFVRDNGALLILLLILLLLLGCFVFSRKKVRSFWERLENDEAFYKHLRKILLLILLGISLFWTLATQYNAGADQFSVQQSVYTLHARDYYQFDPETGGYISRYPNQQGLLLISYLLSVPFGNYNYVVFQLISAVCIAVIYYELSEITLLLGLKKRVSLAVIAGGFLFFPLIMYTAFVYGTVPGLACSLFAIRKELEFFESGKAKPAVLSGIFMVLACLFKNNYLIFLVGAVLFALVRSLSLKRLVCLALPFLTLALYFGQAKATDLLLEKVTGYPVVEGTSPWSFIAMGLQRNSSRAPGWYNSYNYSSYGKAGYDGKKQADTAKENIRESLQYFVENKREALEFFSKKTASQWNNPNFQAFWIVQVRGSDVSKSDWLYAFVSTRGEHLATAFLNALHFLILAGALLFTVFYGKTEKAGENLLLPMIFVGGFVFHLFWEAKAQYTIPYFTLLLPLAASGYNSLFEEILLRDGEARKAAGASPREKRCFIFTGILYLLLTLALYGGYGRNKGDFLRADEEDYRTFLEETSVKPVLSGKYRLVCPDGRKLCLTEKDGLCLLIGEGTVFIITEYQGNYWIHSETDRLYLKTADSELPDKQNVEAVKSSMNNAEKWQIVRLEGDGFAVLCNSKKSALCWDPGSQRLYVSARNENDIFQIWYAEEVK